MSKLRDHTMNMTVGRPMPLLIAFALPMLIGNIFQQMYNIVDLSVVGRFVGADALAAVGSTGSITFLFIGVSNGIGAGCGIVTSQYYGAQNDTLVRKSIANSAYIMLAAAAVMGFLAYAAAPTLLRLMGTPAEVLPAAITYMRITCMGVPLVAVYNYASSMLRALGDSRTPLYFLIVSCILNIGMDLFFVCVLQMGVFGAAFATIIAQVIAGIGCLLFAISHNSYFHLRREEFKADGRIITHSVRLGLPLAMQWSMISVSSIALQTFVNGFGTSAMAAFTATNRIETLLHQPYGSLSAALSTFAGQNYGAKRNDRVQLGIRDGFVLVVGFSLVMLVMVQLLSGTLISVFVDDPEVIRIGSTALKITSWFYVFLGVIYVTRGALNGVGDALFALINGIVEMAGRIFLPMLLVLIPVMGMWGIWWTTCLTWLLSALFCTLRYLAWYRRKGRLAPQ